MSERVEQAETEIDNLRAAFAWSRESSDIELALQLASSLQPLWLTRGRIQEGLAWFDAALADENAPPPRWRPRCARGRSPTRPRSTAWVCATVSMDEAEQALAIARELDDPALLARALTACGSSRLLQRRRARPYFAEAIGLARALGDRWRLSQILGWQARGASSRVTRSRRARPPKKDATSPTRSVTGSSRVCVAGASVWHRCMQGDLVGAVAQFRELVAEAEAAHDVLGSVAAFSPGPSAGLPGRHGCGPGRGRRGHRGRRRVRRVLQGLRAMLALAIAALAAGDVAAARRERGGLAAHQCLHAGYRCQCTRMAQIALARGDLVAARRWADDAVSATMGWHLVTALTTRARVAIAQGEPEQAERDAHDALACAAGHRGVAGLSRHPGVPRRSGRARRQSPRSGPALRRGRRHPAAHRAGRFKIYEAGYEASVAALRNSMGEDDFESGWAEGAALSTEEAIAYAQRGRGERKRPKGWASLTPTEHNVVRLVSEGLANKDIATGFSSHRGPCKPTSPTSTPNSASSPACNWLTRRLASTATQTQTSRDRS